MKTVGRYAAHWLLWKPQYFTNAPTQGTSQSPKNLAIFPLNCVDLISAHSIIQNEDSEPTAMHFTHGTAAAKWIFNWESMVKALKCNLPLPWLASWQSWSWPRRKPLCTWHSHPSLPSSRGAPPESAKATQEETSQSKAGLVSDTQLSRAGEFWLHRSDNGCTYRPHIT